METLFASMALPLPLPLFIRNCKPRRKTPLTLCFHRPIPQIGEFFIHLFVNEWIIHSFSAHGLIMEVNWVEMAILCSRKNSTYISSVFNLSFIILYPYVCSVDRTLNLNRNVSFLTLFVLIKLYIFLMLLNMKPCLMKICLYTNET